MPPDPGSKPEGHTPLPVKARQDERGKKAKMLKFAKDYPGALLLLAVIAIPLTWAAIADPRTDAMPAAGPAGEASKMGEQVPEGRAVEDLGLREDLSDQGSMEMMALSCPEGAERARDALTEFSELLNSKGLESTPQTMLSNIIELRTAGISHGEANCWELAAMSGAMIMRRNGMDSADLEE